MNTCNNNNCLIEKIASSRSSRFPSLLHSLSDTSDTRHSAGIKISFNVNFVSFEAKTQRLGKILGNCCLLLRLCSNLYVK